MEAVQAKLTEAQETAAAITVTAASAQASWMSIKELHGFKRGEDQVTYDQAEHERITQAYDVEIKAANEEVKAWREALQVVMEWLT